MTRDELREQAKQALAIITFDRMEDTFIEQQTDAIMALVDTYSVGLVQEAFALTEQEALAWLKERK